MFGFGKKKQTNEKEQVKNSNFNDLIADFDEEAYLEANPDVKEGIGKGQFRDARHHLEIFGLDEIEQGLRKFHNDFELFDESNYLILFPNLEAEMEKTTFDSFFNHFCQVGYKTVIMVQSYHRCDSAW